MKLRKILTTGVAAVMVLSIAAYGGKKEEKVSLDGTWVSEVVDMTESFVNSFDESFDSNVSIREYLPQITQTATITLEKDNTYTLDTTCDVDIEAFRSNFVDFLGEVFSESNDGVPFTDEEFEAVFGESLEEVAAEYLTDDDIDFLFGPETFEGDYTEKDGAVILDEGTEYEISGTFDGKILTLDLSSVDMGNVTFTKK